MLFHGPMARDHALQRAKYLGRMIGEPIGDKGLKVDDSRKIVVLSQSSGVGDKPPTVVIGPIDNATLEASDALLKTLEDLAEGPLKIVLWAFDLHRVIGTIRSRTLPKWCPPTKTYVSPTDYMLPMAKDLMKAVKEKDELKVLEILNEKDNKKYYDQLLIAFTKVLSEQVVKGDTHLLRFWTDLRESLNGKGSFLVAVRLFLKNM